MCTTDAGVQTNIILFVFFAFSHVFTFLVFALLVMYQKVVKKNNSQRKQKVRKKVQNANAIQKLIQKLHCIAQLYKKSHF